MATPVRPEERLFSLVLTLLATDHGLTKQQIFATVRGFEPESNGGASMESLERKFERDKSDLRDLGIPLETVESPEAPGDNQLLKYRIPRDEYVFPADIDFSSAELALLNLAGEVWREGTVSEVSHRALTKIRSFDVEPDAPILGYVPRLRTREAVFDDLNHAIDSEHRVRFDYLKPGDRVTTVRDVTPFALGLADGRWHLLGFDHTRDAERTFLLSRITSKVSLGAGAAHPIPADAGARLIAGLDAVTAKNEARLRVRAGSTSASELSNRPHSTVGATNGDWVDIHTHFLDEHAFAEELAGCGPEVRVVEPTTLAEQVRTLLELALSTHGGTQ